MIVNKKLNKQFKTILASSESALVILQEEAEKIDERFKKLAELEKAEFAEQIKSLTSQIEMCKSFLNPTGTYDPEPECPVPSEETAEGAAPADTLFPIDEHSEQEEDSKKEFDAEGWTETEENSVDAKEEEDEGPEFDGAGFTDADNYVEGDGSAETEEESPDSEESEWPSDFPDDWNN